MLAIMQGVTLTIAIIVSLFALSLRPGYALAAYLVSLLWYPTFLPVSIGTIDIPVNRMVVAALFLRCLSDGSIRNKFTWSRLDTCVAFGTCVAVGVPLLTYESSGFSVIENRGGFLLDTWFAYMVARFVITEREAFVSVVKVIAIVLAPLAFLGVVESVTHWQPFAPLRQYCPWRQGGSFVSAPRFGLARAVGPFGHAILFGCGFAMFVPLIYYLRHERGWRTLAYVFSGIAFVGALSCMSSGGWVMIMVVVLCLNFPWLGVRLGLPYIYTYSFFCVASWHSAFL